MPLHACDLNQVLPLHQVWGEAGCCGPCARLGARRGLPGGADIQQCPDPQRRCRRARVPPGGMLALPCMLHYILIFGDLGISRNAIAMRLFCPGMSCQSDNRAFARLAAARSGVCFVSGAGGLLGRHPSTGPQGMEPARPGAGRHLCIEWHACTRRAQSTAIAANLASATAVPCLSQHVTVS